MLNKVILIGNLGRDPECRTMQNGNKVCNLNVATSERWTDKNSGEKQEKTEWHRIVLFGPLADIADKYLTKGSKVYLEGSLQTRKWTDQSGVEKYSTEVVCQGFGGRMIMFGGKGEREERPESDGQVGGGGYDDLDSDVPF